MVSLNTFKYGIEELTHKRQLSENKNETRILKVVTCNINVYADIETFTSINFIKK